jgi:fatty-acyl-CoA synthase
MRNQGIGSWPRRRARKTPDRVAIVHQNAALTYRELDERVTRLARALQTLGVGHGDRVAYLGPNHTAFLESMFATGALGGVFVPLNTRLAAAETEYMLADCGAAVLIFAAECETTVKDIADDISATLLAVGGGYETALSAAPLEPLDEQVGLDEACMIMYTSGTTGRPKGATLTHGNATWNCLNVLVDVDLASDEVTLVTAPMFHTAALNMTCLPTLLKGGQVVIEPGFEPERVIDVIEQRRVTLLFGVPTMYAALAQLPRWGSADLSSVRTLLCGGAPVPEALIHTYLERGLSFVQGYGMTETAPGVLLLDMEASAGARKLGSAGVPHFFTDVRVVRPDGTDVAQGERGEILVHGPNVMPSYWRQHDATAAAFADRDWFRSGDVAVLDEDGYAFIVDRVKDVIISGGENIYPAEVENALYDHPDVAECAVIGVPDSKWGEVGKAVVVARPGAAIDDSELLAFLAARLARYKVPKTVEFVASLPRNATGKLLKAQLRKQYATEQGEPQ